jgi:hypothetical protein
MIVVREVIEEIVLAVKSSGSVTGFVDNLDGTYTVTTSSVGGLESGFKVLLQYSDTSLNRDVISENVTETTFDFTASNVTQPDTWEMAFYFESGHRVELNKKYTNKGKATNKRIQKYPLFWLYTDFTEEPGEGEYAEFETNLQGAIVDFSDKTSYEEQRIDNVFKPVLYKYLELIQIAFNTRPYRDNFVTGYGENYSIKFESTDRPFFGSADGENVLPQATDAIELEVNLKWMQESCFSETEIETEDNIRRTNLVAEWLGGSANDTSGNSYNGTLLNSPTRTTGINNESNTAWHFDSSLQQYIDFGSITEIQGVQKISISTWLKKTSGDFLTVGDLTVSGTQGSHINYSNVNSVICLLRNGGVTLDTTEGELNIDEWTHIVMVYDGTLANNERVKIYKNGTIFSSVTSGTIPTSTSSASRTFRMASIVGAIYNDGDIGVTRVYDDAITEEDIFYLYKEKTVY